MRKWLLAMSLLLASCVQVDDRTTEQVIRPPLQASPISRCMNLGSALEAPYEVDWGYTVRRQDLALLKSAGFDTIRLQVSWSAFASKSPPYTIEPELIARVDEIVRWADELELNIIVNVHHFSGLYRNPDEQEPRLEAIWDQLATHYAGAPDTLIFETINEPHSAMTVARTDAINVRLLDRIRREHPDRWVIFGTADWGTLNGLRESQPEYARNVMLTYHEYDPFNFTHQGAHWTYLEETGFRWGSRSDRKKMMSRLDEVQAIQSETGMPILVGEFGVFQEVPIKQRARWTKSLREGIEARGMSWCYWDFAGELKVYDVDTETWLLEIKEALLG